MEPFQYYDLTILSQLKVLKTKIIFVSISWWDTNPRPKGTGICFHNPKRNYGNVSKQIVKQ